MRKSERGATLSKARGERVGTGSRTENQVLRRDLRTSVLLERTVEWVLMHMKWILVLLAASVATGCATKKELIQDYPGKALPAERIALIRPSGSVYISAIDANYDIQTKGVDAQIAVLPGSHTVSARLDAQGIVGPAPPISLNTRPGGRYLVRAQLGHFTWRPVIQDVTDHPEMWCSDLPDLSEKPGLIDHVIPPRTTCRK